MSNWMIDAAKLDDEQLEILELDPNDAKIVKGCAGSGKTVLAVHKADRVRKKALGSYYILVYTRALRAFIQDGINELGIPDANVMYEWDWRIRRNSPSADYLFIDESQDFSEQDIRFFVSKANKAVVFFGDSAQQVYADGKINYVDQTRENTVNIEAIQKITGLAAIKLKFNHRLPESVAKVAQCILASGEDIVSNCMKKGGDKPVLKKFTSSTAELDWIINKINNEQLTEVGILLSENTQVKFVHDYFQSKGMKAGVRFSQDGKVIEALDFKGNISNIMPYHSSKGLQFDTVFLPFCEENIQGGFWRNAFYVALSRTCKTLVITHTNGLSPFFSEISSSLYQKL
jgi:superfamily I DNA/RNA helicase